MMPEMDGVECRRRILAQPGGKCRDSKIIALTANADSESRSLYEWGSTEQASHLTSKTVTLLGHLLGDERNLEGAGDPGDSQVVGVSAVADE